MRAIHVVASLGLETGGPARTVVQLTNELARHADCHVTLVSAVLRESRTMSSAAAVERHVPEVRSKMSLRFGCPVWRQLHRLPSSAEPSLIHGHGVWHPANHWAARAARNLDIPLVVQPRGMLEPWSLRHRSWRKRVAMSAYQGRDLLAAAMFVATAESEYRSIRDLGLTQPIAVIPNGVSLDGEINRRNRVPIGNDGKRTALFLSRIHVKKGLLNLLEAWSRAAPTGWRLVIAGADEGGHLRQVISHAKALRIDGDVEFAGELEGTGKAEAFSGADLFILPSHSENFGIVVAEALAHGVPVITTRGTPWADLESYRCGWWVDVGVEPLAVAIRSAIAMDDAERQAMGRRGKEYVSRYDWGVLAGQMMDAYRWILGEGKRPSCVRLD